MSVFRHPLRLASVARGFWLSAESIRPSGFHQRFIQVNKNPGNGLIIQRRSVNIAGNTAGQKPPNLNQPRSNAGYVFLILPIATFALGWWQYYRLLWKLELIAKLENMMTAEPAEFPLDNLDAINDMEYVKVKVRGYIDETAEPQFIFPRPLLKRGSDVDHGGSMMSTPNRNVIGAQLIMPFVVTGGTGDSNGEPLKIMVNLGWVNRETMEKINKMLQDKSWEFDIQQNPVKPKEIEFIGIVRKTEQREPFQDKKVHAHGYWTRRDIEKLSDRLGTAPILLEAFESYPLKLLNELDVRPIGAQTRIQLRNQHLSYMMTWWSLTAIFSYLWFMKIFRPRL